MGGEGLRGDGSAPGQVRLPARSPHVCPAAGVSVFKTVSSQAERRAELPCSTGDESTLALVHVPGTCVIPRAIAEDIRICKGLLLTQRRRGAETLSCSTSLRLCVRPRIAQIVLLVGLCFTNELCNGQEVPEKPPEAPAAPEQPATAPAPKPPATPVPADLMYLPDERGRLVPVPAGASLREYMEYLRGKGVAAKSGLPKFAIEKLSLIGEAKEDAARLSAVVVVRLFEDEPWVRVPLGFVEGVLVDARHEGEGEGLCEPRDETNGHHWFLKGAGEHRLLMEVAVPLRKTNPGRRLVMTIPEATVSVASIRIPEAEVAARAAERVTVLVSREAEGARIEATGLGARLDLSWVSTTSAGPKDSSWEVTSQTLVSLVEARSLMWNVTQRLLPTGGGPAPQSLLARLPPGAELVTVEGTDLKETSPEPTDAALIRVHFSKPPTGPVDLRWTLRGSMGSPTESVSLQGISVERARVQSGYVAIAVLGDYRLRQTAEDSKLLFRAAVSELPPAIRRPQVTAAFRILGDQWSTVVSLTPTSPYVVAESRVRVAFRDREIEETITITGQVYRASLSQLKVDWPGFEEEGWVVEAQGLELQVSPETVGPNPDAADPGGGTGMGAKRLLIGFPEPVRDRFEVRLRARRPWTPPVPPVEAGRLSLPKVLVDQSGGMLVDVWSQTGLLVELTDQRRSRSGESPMTTGDDETPQGTYRPAPDQVRVPFRAVRQPRRVEVEATAELSAVDARLSLIQRFRYRVRYGRLDRVSLTFPETAPRGDWRVFGPEGRELVAEETPSTGRSVGYLLGTPPAGEFVVEARFVPRNGGGTLPIDEGTVQVPFVLAGDVAGHPLRLVWQSRGGDALTVADAAWTAEARAPGRREWVCTSAPEGLTAKYTRVEASYWSSVAGTGVWLRHFVESDGSVRTLAHYRLANPPGSIPVNLPPGLELVVARWNGVRVSRPVSVELPEGARSVVLFGPNSGDRLLLTLELEQASGAAPGGIGLVTIAAPEFPAELWLPRPFREVWLPENQHLLTRPDGWSVQYRWAFQGFLFARRPVLSQRQLSRWIGLDEDAVPVASAALTSTAETESDPDFDRAGHRYLFSGGRADGPLTFRTMNRSFLVLVGAGAALVLGFLMVRMRAARSVFTFLVLGAGLALLGLWYPETVAVLLQPAIPGLALAALAAWIDGYVQHRRGQGHLLDPVGDGETSRASTQIPAPAEFPVGSEDFTAVRVIVPEPLADDGPSTLEARVVAEARP